jgi:protein-L-isoaspartate(D-aspartate) O-methyltransferase
MAADDDPSEGLATARRALVAMLDDEVAGLGTGDGTHELDARVREALLKVPRERFVPEQQRHQAYANRPLSIGHGQTISQPFVVAVMSHHLHLTAGARVLEIGTGSGYQTAILAELAAEVVTIEVVEPLAAHARELLEGLGYRNITYRVGDGTGGVPDLAPYEAIVVTAAAPAVPEALVDQLKPGGRLVIPAEQPESQGFFTRPLRALAHGQDLLLVTKDPAGGVTTRVLFPVAFVPLTGEHR